MALGNGNQKSASSPQQGRAAGATFRGRYWSVGTVSTMSIAVAAVLMIIVQLWAFQAPVKWDMTTSGINSLGPGTRAVLQSLDDDKIYLTSLYLETDIETEAQRKYRQAVNDLLRLYQAENPAGVEIEWINPLKDQNRLSRLMERLRARGKFESESQAYVEAIRRFEEEVFGPFKAELRDYVAELTAMGQGDIAGSSASSGIERAVTSWIELGERVIEDIRAVQAEPLPRYSTATQSMRTFYDTVGEKISFVVSTYADQQLQGTQLDDAEKQVLSRMKSGLQPWVERFEQEQERIQNLKPPSLDELERSLKQNNVVLVESSRGAKALSFEDMWPVLREGDFAAPHEFDKRRFAGEGALTPAILQLIQDQKTALVFVRYAGDRLFGVAGFGTNAQQGPLSNLKRELERLNYLVAEWDIKQSQERPAFDETPKRTIYIVLRPAAVLGPQGMRTGETMGPLERAAVLSALGESGRALFLTGWAMFASKYEFAEYLSKKWGMEVDGQSLIITAIPSAPGEWVLSRSFASVSDVKFREHPLTDGLEPLSGQTVFPLATPLSRAAETPEGVTVQELAYVEASEDIWAIKDPPSFVQEFQSRGKTARTLSDLQGPFTLGLVAEKTAEGDEGEGQAPAPDKIVVLAAGHDVVNDDIAVNNVLVFGRDGKLQVRRQAPGNFALFTNILAYLDDTLQWLNVGSPLDHSRVSVSERGLVFWRVLTVGVLPALALFCGGLVWFVRRR